MSTQKFDAYQMVTDRIMALMESGIIPWARPWTGAGAGAWSRRDGKSYSLVNQMLLADPDKNYANIDELLADVRGEWLTFKQALDLGGNVRKGEKGRKVVFFKMNERKTGKTDENGDEVVERFPILMTYTVFRVDQCDGITQKWYTDAQAERPEFIDNLTAENVIADYIRREGVTMNLVHGNRAYYSPAIDTVVLPIKEQFSSVAEYYSTAMHELAHSTGHESRLNRLHGVAAFGDDVYSTEELTAEICAASVMATLGIDTAGSLRNSAAYVQNWLKALKNDKKMIVVASARAEKALQLLLDVVKPTPDKTEGNTEEEPKTETTAPEAVQPVTVQAQAVPAMQTLYSAPQLIINALEIKHPNGVMFLGDLRNFFPMTQKDFKIILPLLRYIDVATLQKFRYTLGIYRAEEELTNNRKTYLKRISDNIAMLEKAYPAAIF